MSRIITCLMVFYFFFRRDDDVLPQGFLGLIDGVAQIFFGDFLVLVGPQQPYHLVPADDLGDQDVIEQGVDLGVGEKDALSVLGDLGDAEQLANDLTHSSTS